MGTSPMRVARVANQVRVVLSTALLRQVKDPVLESLSISDVEVSGDLRVAKVFFYLSDPSRRGEIQGALERAKGFLRRQLGAELRLRVTPELRFVFDNSIERGSEIEALLARVREEDARRAEESATRAAQLSEGGPPELHAQAPLEHPRGADEEPR